MYHNSGFFTSHQSHPIRGEEASALSFHHEFPTAMELDFRFNLKQELNFHDPSILSNPSFLHMLVPPPLRSTSEVFLGELPADSASTDFYCPTAHLGLPDQHQPLNPAPPFGVGLDECYSGQKNKPKRKQSPNVEKHEKQRRERLAEKFEILKSILPNSTKPDRATIVSDAMDYIKELLRTVNELKLLVEKRRRQKEKSKTVEMENEVVAGDMESSSITPLIDGRSNAQSRTQWIQRKTKETLVDVRIVEEEVTIKITQRAKNNNLLAVSKTLDDLRLELIHLSGGYIGDHYIFLFNAKIHESSSVYASAIAEKLLEVMGLHSN